ncbi:hypothetical protein ACTJKC_13975 [Pedobacter sp. 22226]|uniref:hypothetical protein n=1 Tax=Pedobacter sp. 22226 TaxID=3453894 RepID=UPI003F82D02D
MCKANIIELEFKSKTILFSPFFQENVMIRCFSEKDQSGKTKDRSELKVKVKTTRRNYSDKEQIALGIVSGQNLSV